MATQAGRTVSLQGITGCIELLQVLLLLARSASIHHSYPGPANPAPIVLLQHLFVRCANALAARIPPDLTPKTFKFTIAQAITTSNRKNEQ